MKQHVCAVQGRTVVAIFPHVSCKCKYARRKYEGLKITKSQTWRTDLWTRVREKLERVRRMERVAWMHIH